MAYLETMTTGSAQNNTDWGNKEYDQLLKVAEPNWHFNRTNDMKT